MKSDRPKALKTRSKLQFVAIGFLVTFIGIGSARFMIAWFHNPGNIAVSLLHIMNYATLAGLAAYVFLEVWYYRKKHRLL